MAKYDPKAFWCSKCKKDHSGECETTAKKDPGLLDKLDDALSGGGAWKGFSMSVPYPISPPNPPVPYPNVTVRSYGGAPPTPHNWSALHPSLRLHSWECTDCQALYSVPTAAFQMGANPPDFGCTGPAMNSTSPSSPPPIVPLAANTPVAVGQHRRWKHPGRGSDFTVTTAPVGSWIVPRWSVVEDGNASSTNNFAESDIEKNSDVIP